MTKVVYEFSGLLEVRSPLHIGSGHFERRSCVEGRDGANAPPEVATIARDALGRPYIPATALKGLLRGLAEADDGDTVRADVRELFGLASDGIGEAAQMGAVLLRGATFVSAPDTSALPFVTGAAARQELGPGVFVAARTQVDGALGTAADARLFFQEMVVPGAQFRFRAVIERASRATDREPLHNAARRAAERFARVLRRLTDQAGRSVGKGVADGLGRIRLLDASVAVTRRELDAAGDFRPRRADEIWTRSPRVTALRKPPGESRQHRMTLRCRGPFIVVDASRHAKPGMRREDDSTPQIRPQRLSQTAPLLLGTGISGALRARAHWLAAVQGAAEAGKAPAGQPADPVDRLFGVTDFRGLVTIENIVVNAKGTMPITSVNLDRFSGGPVDNKLFKTEVFVDVTLAFALNLAGRGGALPTRQDITLFDDLVRDITANGLQLGHGTNKGFGWFETQENRHAGQ